MNVFKETTESLKLSKLFFSNIEKEEDIHIVFNTIKEIFVLFFLVFYLDFFKVCNIFLCLFLVKKKMIDVTRH